MYTIYHLKNVELQFDKPIKLNSWRKQMRVSSEHDENH